MHWRSRLLHSKVKAPSGFRSLATPVHRGSTLLFERQADVMDNWNVEKGYSYGLYGTPTTLELGARIAEMEGARFSFVVPGGQAAIALTYLSYCRAGSHALIPFSAYGPNKDIAEGLLKKLDITVETYDPLIGGEIGSLIRPETALVWCESPGSVTMEIQDVPAIAAAARAKGVTVACDNTYAAGILFDAIGAGVDVSIQSLTKYVGGHSDVLLGTVSPRDDAAYQKIGPIFRQLGLSVSPDECSLALRGLQTLGVRLERLEASTLAIATWLSKRAEISTILHPAFASCPGHDLWKRDFTGSASVFSIVFGERYTSTDVERFVDALRLFRIGMSWGGTVSLAIVYPDLERPGEGYRGRLVRLCVGLEEPLDLIADLASAFAVLQTANRRKVQP